MLKVMNGIFWAENSCNKTLLLTINIIKRLKHEIFNRPPQCILRP